MLWLRQVSLETYFCELIVLPLVYSSNFQIKRHQVRRTSSSSKVVWKYKLESLKIITLSKKKRAKLKLSTECAEEFWWYEDVYVLCCRDIYWHPNQLACCPHLFGVWILQGFVLTYCIFKPTWKDELIPLKTLCDFSQWPFIDIWFLKLIENVTGSVLLIVCCRPNKVGLVLQSVQYLLFIQTEIYCL